jgi:ribonuclease-3
MAYNVSILAEIPVADMLTKIQTINVRVIEMHKLLMFKDENLLRRALTHRSYVNENSGETQHNERLEFLGDAILNFISGEYLYQHLPEMQEDEMTRRRAALVDEKQLARFAIEIGLEGMMRLGRGAIQDGGYQNPNLLSSTFEAVVGAYYLDHNRDIAAVRPLIEELFRSVPVDIIESRSNLDSKNRFQELVQASLSPHPPTYKTERIGGRDHAPEFVARVYVNNQLYGEGRGRSKKEAEKIAAENGITKLQSNNEC